MTRNFNLSEKLNGQLVEFCRRTRRQEPHVLRSILELFFADGFEAAELRLTTGLWQESDKEAASTHRPPGMTAEQWGALSRADRAEYIVSGQLPGPKRRKKGGAA